MKNKRVRGQKRKLNSLLKRIDDISPRYNDAECYEHFHVPCDGWISNPKANGKVKTEFCKKWLNKTEEIIEGKPQGLRFCRVVANIVDPYFGDSQIIIFYDEGYYNTFFDRQGPYQIWTKLDNNKSFVKRRGISTGLNETGYHETLNEDGYTAMCEIWFYGE